MIEANCEVAVIGGGILGSASAAMLSQQGYSVCVFRLNNRRLPRADTLRNQGWLQSGLMYVGKLGKDRQRGRLLANRMYNAGLTMLETLGLPVPNGIDGGIIRLRPDGNEESHLLDDAASLGISDFVQKLDAREAERRLGPVYESGLYYSIPDAPFPEATVLELFRSQATTFGTSFVECESSCTLERDAYSPSGHVVVCGERRFSTQVTIIAAGAGSYDLLQGVGLDPRMRLQQTPLLVVDRCHAIESPIFADRPRGFSFVRHAPDNNGFPNGALVIGTGVYEADAPKVAYEDRRIAKAKLEEFRSSLPAFLQPFVDTGRFTAGYEVVPDHVEDGEGNDLHYVEPWIEWVGVNEGMRLLLTMPGRATLGLHAAEIVLDRFVEQGVPAPANLHSSGEAHIPWDESIHMHFHPHYNFDDRAPSEGGG